MNKYRDKHIQPYNYNMEAIIEKLKTLDNTSWEDWNIEEIQQLLRLYSTISKYESHIFKIIYRYHGCDSWEDIFRDYDMQYLKDKERGVDIALEMIEELQQEKTESEI